MASPDVPASLRIEDVIERAILFIKAVSKELLFPTHDSSYVAGLTPKKKGETWRELVIPHYSLCFP